MTAYARQVVDKAIMAGPHVRDACLRHLRDIEKGPKRGLRWDAEEAKSSIGFFSDVLRLNGGEFEGKPFELHCSQAFIVGSLFGWKNDRGHRRFHVAYIEEGKGNGKSPMVAGIGLKMLVADREPRAEVYAFATKKDQAQILFRDAVAMVDQSPELDKRLDRAGGKGREWNISDAQSASFFRPVASDDAQSGPRPHCAIGDEVHEHKTPLMIEMMRAGTKNRRQALIILITNSGTDRQSACWEKHEYGAKVASGAIEDDTFFSYICALDEGDDPFESEDCWPKANPLIDVCLPREYLREQVREAKGMPSKESMVRRLNFCQWVESENPWLLPEVWREIEDKEYDADLLLGRRCYGGLDLSSTTDLTALALLFAPTETDKHWRLKTWFWIPEDTLDKGSQADVIRKLGPTWRASGDLTTTRGGAINKLFILAKLVDCHSKYDIVSIGYDRWRIEDIKTQMQNEGVELPLQPFGQGFKDMAPAVDEFDRLLVSRELRHDGNAVMNWNASVVTLETDPAGNRKPTKERSGGRIDGVVAACMAAGRILAAKEDSAEYQMFVV